MTSQKDDILGGPLRRDRTPKGSRWWKRNQRVLQVEEPAGNAASTSNSHSNGSSTSYSSSSGSTYKTTVETTLHLVSLRTKTFWTLK